MRRDRPESEKEGGAPRKPAMAEEAGGPLEANDDEDAHIEQEQLQETFESPRRDRDRETVGEMRESSGDMERE